MSKLFFLSLQAVKQMKMKTKLLKVFQLHRGCNFRKFQLKASDVFQQNAEMSYCTCFYANFTIEMTGDETGPLLKCVNFSRNFFNKHET